MRQAILFCTLLAMLHSIANCQILPFSTDFNSNGDPVTWRAGGDGSGDSIENGNLVLENTGGYLGVFPDETSISNNPVIDSVIRTQFRVTSLGSNSDGAGFYSLASRATSGNIYWGGVRGNGNVVIGSVHDGTIIIEDELFTSLNPTAHDVTLELKTVGSNVSLSVWNADDGDLVVETEFTDEGVGAPLGPGNVGVYINGSTGRQRSAEFRWFEAIPYQVSLCDLDGDFDCDHDDINSLYAAFGSSGKFDFDGDGVVGAGDIQGWLDAASSPTNPANPSGHTFVIGDTNFDGQVDSTDLGLLLNAFGEVDSWIGGDFNGDDNVDSIDLGLLLNNFGHTSAAAVAVPEPAMPWLWMGLMLFAVGLNRKRNTTRQR